MDGTMKKKFEQLLSHINQQGLDEDNLSHVLASVQDEMLEFFNCDRAWCLYPCDPETESWRVPMERTRPEWPGAKELNIDLPATEGDLSVFSTHVNANKPVTFGRNADYPLPETIRKSFSVQSQMGMVIYPKTGKPWLFGIHHCANEHHFSKEEINFFSILVEKISSVLGNLILLQRLRESEDYNRRLFHSTPIGLTLCNLDGKFVDVNESFTHIAGCSVDESLALNLREFAPEDYIEKLLRKNKLPKRTGVFSSVESIYRRKNGSDVHISISSVIVEKDNSSYIWSNIEDITQRKILDKELMLHKENLEETIRQRTYELNESKKTADLANRAKSDFLSSMSHELRTPLNAILGFAQLLEMEESDDSKKENISEIIQGGNHLLELVNEILDLSKIESGKVELSVNSHNLNELLNRSLSFIKPIVNQNSIQIDNKISSSSDFTINVDETRFLQVLLNLLSNAIKYNSENGKVTIDCSPIDGNMLYISVTDTGAGLTPEQQRQLFTPFERVGAEKSKIKGTGLGLVISKNLIELMGGEMGAESQVGKGSCFWMQVPLV